MSIDINKHETDIDNLKKQNELDLCSIKDLYKRLDKLDSKISQIKYIDELLGNKFKKELEKLKELVQNGVGQPEGGQTEMNNKINEINTRLDNLNNIIDEIENQVSNNTNDIENLRQQIVGTNNSQNHNHSNLNVLEKISEVGSKLYFNGLPVETEIEGTTENNVFKGKVANFLGDSQTEVNFHKNKIYHDWVKENLGLSKVNNYGIGGTTIAKKSTTDNTAMSVRYTNMDNNADLICVMGGVNDRWHNTQLGKFGDTDAITFYGAMETLCDGLLTKYPGKTIIFITPTEQNSGMCNSNNTTGYTVTEFANAMKRVCAKYSIPVFDANTCSGIYPLNEAHARLYTDDKLHLNDEGHKVLGNKLSKFILNGVIMINNDSEDDSEGGSTSDTYSNIVISKSSITVSEGNNESFTVKLDKAPTNSQTVNISCNNSDVTLSPKTLTFDNTNYSTPQTVTINVSEDSDSVNDNCTITLSSNNVSSKTINIIINDNDSPSVVPPENYFVGKKVTVSKNYQNDFVHLVALLNVDDDMKSESTYDIVLRGSNTSNMSNGTHNGGPLFSDNSGEVSNGLSVSQIGTNVTFTQTVSNGNLTITAPTRKATIPTNYVKVPIILSGSTPYSFIIDEIKVIVNNVERNILKLGSFFANNSETVTIE